METKNMPVVKYILTDDYKPLYAMKKVYGPPNGPIRNPIRVPVDIIGEILNQFNAPKLFEVIPVGQKANGIPEYSDRVELTLENYRESWYTISGLEIPAVGLGEAVKTEEVKVVETPVNVEADKEPVQTESEVKEPEIPVSEPVEPEASKEPEAAPVQDPKVEAPTSKGGKNKKNGRPEPVNMNVEEVLGDGTEVEEIK